MISDLNKSEKLFKALVENQYSLTVLVNDKFEAIYNSPSSEAITGWIPKKGENHNVEERVHPDDKEYLRGLMEESLQNPGKQVPLLLRSLHKNGGYIWLEGIAVNMLHDPDVGAIVTNLRDITDRKEAEQKIADSEKKYHYLFNHNPMPMWVIDVETFNFLDVNEAAQNHYGYTRKEFLSMTALEIRPNEDREKFLTLDRQSNSGIHSAGIWRHLKKDGALIYTDVSVDEIIFNGVKARLILSNDVTERIKADEKIAKANKLYFFISQVNQMIVRSNDEETLFREACTIAVNFGKFKMAWIGMIDFETEKIKLVSHNGMAAEDLKLFENTSYDNKGPQAHVLKTGSNYVCNNIENEFKLEGWKEFATTRNLRSMMVLPIFRSGKIIGSFNFYSEVTDFFDNEEIALLEKAAGDVSFALGVFEKEHLRQFAERQLLAKNDELKNLTQHLQNIREEERTYIAREIHDELGQELTALKMDIDWIKHKQKDAGEKVVSKLGDMLLFTDRIINTVRRIASELRPGIIDDLGLIAALEWKCSDFMEKTGVVCTFVSDIADRQFSSDFSINVFRILQETLTNITRHARAEKVAVWIYENENSFIMEVNDDGKGILNEELTKGKSLGIVGMQERAILLGGELNIEGSRNRGTKVKLTLPI